MKIPPIHMSKSDAFILANYRALGPTKIAKRLGMPKGSVITRHKILMGIREKGQYHARPGFYKLNPRASRGRFSPGGLEPNTTRRTPGMPKIGLDR